METMTRFVESTIAFPYQRSLGPVLGAFMTALTDRRILGSPFGDRVLVPPMEWDPDSGEALAAELVEVGPAGTVESWTWVQEPSVQHPLDRPFAFAYIRLDGATSPLLHAVDAGSSSSMTTGIRVAPRWRGTRIGHITDISCFVPGEAAETEAPDTGAATSPVTMMSYDASISYRNPVPSMADRLLEASRNRRLVGLQCPLCGRITAGGDRPYCAVDGIELGSDEEVDLADRGTVTNFVVVTPVQYPGQTETEPFACVFVLLDDSDVVLTYQQTIELPVADLRVGLRVGAVWASPGEASGASAIGRSMGSLLGWMPNGEPDIDDPELVNRIY
jgi:uncharacterized protein